MVVVPVLCLSQEFKNGVFDCRSGAFDNFFEANGQGIEFSEALGNVVAVRLFGDKLVQLAAA